MFVTKKWDMVLSYMNTAKLLLLIINLKELPIGHRLMQSILLNQQVSNHMYHP